MSSQDFIPFCIFIGFCILLIVLQGLLALPWITAIDRRTRQLLKDWKVWAIGLGICIGAGVAAGVFLEKNDSSKDALAGWGRFYMSVLHLQVGADLIVLVFFLMQQFWSKGGAVALAAFREGLRQPMFWVLTLVAGFLMLGSPILPYFTFGEDLKMVKNLCYEFAMLAALLFGVVSAAISVHEEIEGRTAITVMSKPISRRQFFLGKFLGILLSALVMTILLGWLFIWVILLKQGPLDFDRIDPQARTIDPYWVAKALSHFHAGTLADLVRGLLLWTADMVAVLPGVTLGFCQVMVLVALATALATRLPMVVNLSFCLAVYFLGNLAPIMVAVARKNEYPLLVFVSQVFETILPGLELFDVSSNVTRDLPLPLGDYYLYTLNVVLYAVTYSAAALIFGLILFEDRDLA